MYIYINACVRKHIYSVNTFPKNHYEVSSSQPNCNSSRQFLALKEKFVNCSMTNPDKFHFFS